MDVAIEAIASLPDDALGMNSEGVGDTPGLMHSWPIRDELLHNLRKVRAADEVLRAALEAWGKLAGYGKMERMRAALEAALNHGGRDAR